MRIRCNFDSMASASITRAGTHRCRTTPGTRPDSDGWVAHGFQKRLEARGYTDVLRRCLPGAIDQNGVLGAGFGGQGSFDGDPVHLLVAQVVNVGKAVDAALEELIQAEVGAAVDGVAAQGLAGFLWRAVAAAVGLKLVQVAVFQSKTA
jgi:hypothetical protein